MNNPKPFLIPVFDLLKGQIVHAIGGDRTNYRPVESRYSRPAHPFDWITQIVHDYLPEHIYVADLDGIIHSQYSWELYRKLALLPCLVWLDMGMNDCEQLKRVLDLGVNVVLGLESLPNPESFFQMLTVVRSETERLGFSLDLRGGVPVASSFWPADPLVIAERVFEKGIRKLIVLDLTSVGLSKGVPTLDLCYQLKQRHPEWEIWTGGGIRDRHDLEQLADFGVTGGLVSTALHNGQILPL